jgi:hypothetical protein
VTKFKNRPLGPLRAKASTRSRRRYICYENCWGAKPNLDMSALGHLRRFGRTTATSGLRRGTDILRIGGHVFKRATRGHSEVGKRGPMSGLTQAPDSSTVCSLFGSGPTGWRCGA